MLATPSVSAILRMSVFCPLKAKAEVRAITFRPGIFANALMIFFGQAVAEILLFLVTAHVGKGQHRDGRLRVLPLGRDSLKRNPEILHGQKTVRRLLGEALADDALKFGGCLQRRGIVA